MCIRYYVHGPFGGGSRPFGGVGLPFSTRPYSLPNYPLLFLSVRFRISPTQRLNVFINKRKFPLLSESITRVREWMVLSKSKQKNMYMLFYLLNFELIPPRQVGDTSRLPFLFVYYTKRKRQQKDGSEQTIPLRFNRSWLTEFLFFNECTLSFWVRRRSDLRCDAFVPKWNLQKQKNHI